MRIWVDADSCPSRARAIIARAAVRTGIEAVFVANRRIPLDEGSGVSLVITEACAGAADSYIEAGSSPPDIVITRDIPLAARLVGRGLTVLNDRGTVFDAKNVAKRLAERDLMLAVRSSPDYPEAKASYGAEEAKSFADAFDRVLMEALRRHPSGKPGGGYG